MKKIDYYEISKQKMKLKDHKKFTYFNYISEQPDPDYKFGLGDIVIKFEDGNADIGIIIQIHDRYDYRTDSWGNESQDNMQFASLEQIERFRPELLEHIDS